MPFTLAHPAIVMPFRKSPVVSITGLVIGSMVPDMEFYLQMEGSKNIGHQWYGIFLFDLPFALFLAFLFHNVLRNMLISNLPDMYRKRLIHLKKVNWNKYAFANKWKVILSIVAGTVSHLAWDSFTHHDGTLVGMMPLLSENINLAGVSIHVYYLLQIVFSILGMMVVHFQIMRMPVVQKDIKDSVDYNYWLVFGVLFLSILAVRSFVLPGYNNFGAIAVAVMGSAFYSWVAVSLIFNYKSKLKKENNKMSITSSPIRVVDSSHDSLHIASDGDLVASAANEVRDAVEASANDQFSTIYLDLKDVPEMDLSGVNEVINSYYTLKQRSKKMILVYRKGSSVEKWVGTTGLDKFIETAIIV